MAILSKISSLKPGTRKLMDVLKRIKNVQTGFKHNISIHPKSFGRANRDFVLGATEGPARRSLPDSIHRVRNVLAQSHKQVKRIGKGKGYREYLKRMK